MTAASPPLIDFGWRAPDFHLADTRGRVWSLKELRGASGLVLVFMCNHCPYVQAIADKLVREGKALRDLGFGMAGICSNDVGLSPADGFQEMGAFARQHHLPFPYLHDVSQSVARAYGAACTPDFFGFDADLGLQYRGRFDDSGRAARPGARRELHEAMRQVAETGRGPAGQTPSIGCSIKWKAA
jgi:peroxiredoxin